MSSSICEVIYDKYCGIHGFNNPKTKNITLKELYNKYIDTAKHYTDEKAIQYYNSKFPVHMHIKYIDTDIIIPNIVKFYNERKEEVIITFFSIDIKKVISHFNKYNELPYSNYILDICKYHILYEKTISKTLDNYTNEIIKRVLVPRNDILEDGIPMPDFIVSEKQLYNYQRRTIKWMIDIEQNVRKIHYGGSAEFDIGPFVYDALYKKITLNSKRKSIKFYGGALIDEVGLGKTIQMISLCILNPPLANTLTYINTRNKMLNSCATLIICPNQLCGQWLREITTMTTTKNLKIISLLTKTHFDKYTYADLLNADFVIVSFNFIANSIFALKYTADVSPSKSYNKSYDYDHKKVQEVLCKMSDKLITDPSNLFKSETLFHLIYWHRVIIDEFHEIYTIPKYIFMKNFMHHIKSKYKWVVTGTPFDKESQCFYEMFNFVTNYKTYDKNIFCSKNIIEYMNNLFFRRNTKQSVDTEFKLMDLREKIIWLKFSSTERMMYNAYLADACVDKYAVILRQLCCHPKIAEEIKDVLKKCTTLADIENKMVVHYKEQYIKSLYVVRKYEQKKFKVEHKFLTWRYKRQRKCLKKNGYKVKIILPDLQYNNATLETLITTLEEKEEKEEKKEKKVIQEYNDDSDSQEEEIVESESDNEDNDNEDEKKLMIVNKENQEQIFKLIGSKLNETSKPIYASFMDRIQKYMTKLANANATMNGKKTSYVFFTNMLEKLKKITNKKEDDEEEDEDNMCGICLCEIASDDIGTTKCGHLFCYKCLKSSIESMHKCPICRTTQSVSDISLISYEKPIITENNASIIKNKLELINKVGTKLTNLIYYLNSIDEHVIIFSQWDALLRKVGDVLTEHGIPNVFCKGSVWSRDKAIREFNSNDNIKVIMLSSELAASGTNLTKASKVILLDPVSGTYEYRRNTEWQAIGRAYRLGQTKSVEIVRFIVKDTVEEDIYNENKISNAEHKHNIVISEVTDDTITLSDDTIKSIQTRQPLKANKVKKKVVN